MWAFERTTGRNAANKESSKWRKCSRQVFALKFVVSAFAFAFVVHGPWKALNNSYRP